MEEDPEPSTRKSFCYFVIHFLFCTLPVLLFDAVSLIVFVIALSPGYARFFWYYTHAGRVVERYGEESCRQKVDIFQQTSSEDGPAPVLVFFTGGAWMIGYKMWGALIAKALNPMGILVIIPDYRNYPSATVPTMVGDVDRAIQWAFDNCERFGGDPNKLVVVGQSAGGHLSCCAILRRALSLTRENTEIDAETDTAAAAEASDRPVEAAAAEQQPDASTRGYRVTDIKGFMSLSAPTNLEAMEYSFRRHGLDKSLVLRIFGGSLDEWNPHYLIRNREPPNASWSDVLPPISILHGTQDKTVPHGGSVQFVADLNSVHETDFVSYPGWSHTDPIVEGPMNAEHQFHRDVLERIKVWTDTPELVFDEEHPACKRMCPSWMISVGRMVNPF